MLDRMIPTALLGSAGIFLRPVMPWANVSPEGCADGYFARLNAMTAQLEPAAEIH